MEGISKKKFHMLEQMNHIWNIMICGAYDSSAMMQCKWMWIHKLPAVIIERVDLGKIKARARASHHPIITKPSVLNITLFHRHLNLKKKKRIQISCFWILTKSGQQALRDSDDEHFSFCAWNLGCSSLLRRMGKSQDKNDDVEVTVVAVLYVVAFLL